jgi:hypothetical protein
MPRITANARRIHGHTGVDDSFDGPVDAEPDAAMAEGVALVPVDDEVDVEVDVDVAVDVDVVVVVGGGCVCVDVDVEVEVDVLVGDRLEVGAPVVASALGGSLVRDTVGVRDGTVGAIVREMLGRLEPPPHDDATVMSARTDAIGSARDARSRTRPPRRRLNLQAPTEGMSIELVSPRSTPSP